jgi:hypothetical protein
MYIRSPGRCVSFYPETSELHDLLGSCILVPVKICSKFWENPISSLQAIAFIDSFTCFFQV